ARNTRETVDQRPPPRVGCTRASRFATLQASALPLSWPAGPSSAPSAEGGSTRMFESADEVLSFIRKNDVQFVDVRFCDLPGVMQHFTFPASNFGESVFTDGLMFDGSSIRGFQQIHESDMLLLPDPSTAYLDPFRQHPTLVM